MDLLHFLYDWNSDIDYTLQELFLDCQKVPHNVTIPRSIHYQRIYRSKQRFSTYSSKMLSVVPYHQRGHIRTAYYFKQKLETHTIQRYGPSFWNKLFSLHNPIENRKTFTFLKTNALSILKKNQDTHSKEHVTVSHYIKKPSLKTYVIETLEFKPKHTLNISNFYQNSSSILFHYLLSEQHGLYQLVQYRNIERECIHNPYIFEYIEKWNKHIIPRIVEALGKHWRKRIQQEFFLDKEYSYYFQTLSDLFGRIILRIRRSNKTTYQWCFPSFYTSTDQSIQTLCLKEWIKPYPAILNEPELIQDTTPFVWEENITETSTENRIIQSVHINTYEYNDKYMEHSIQSNKNWSYPYEFFKKNTKWMKHM